MPYQSVRLQPGIDIEQTPLLNQGGWSDGQFVRWMENMPQKLGGWAKYYSNSFNSPIRALHAWLINTHTTGPPESADQIAIAIAAENGLNVLVKDNLGNVITKFPKLITPRTAVINPNTVIGGVYGPTYTPITYTFTTYDGIAKPKNQVDIHGSANHNLSSFSSVNFTTPVAIPGTGLILYGAYNVTPINPTDFTIFTDSDATAAVGSPTPVAGQVPVFTTTANSPIINVNLPNHGFIPDQSNQEFDFQVPTIVDGLTVSGVYHVFDVVDVNDYHIVAETSATGGTSAAMNSFAASPSVGNIQIVTYPVNGPSLGAVGWGGSPDVAWGGYQQTSSGPPPVFVANVGWGGYELTAAQIQSTGTPITAGDYTLDNWGTYLVACPDQGPIFYWDNKSGADSARLITQAPLTNHGIFVSMPLQILVAYGSTDDSGVHDPLLVRWCDSGNLFDWTPTSQNQAGSFRIPEGSHLISGMSVGQQAILWTDIETWSMNYLGVPLVFGFNKVSMASGIISRHGACQLMDQLFWMGQGNFFTLAGGGVQEVHCNVWDKVYQNINRAAAGKVCCAPNSIYNEVSWFYPSLATIPAPFSDGSRKGSTHSNTTIDALSPNAQNSGWLPKMQITGAGIPSGTTIVSISSDGSSIQLSQVTTATATNVALTVTNADPSTGEVDSYVKYTLENKAWDYGPLQRTAWIDQSAAGAPIGADASGYVYQHELTTIPGVGDTALLDADNVPMQSFITTAWFAISEGDPVTFVDLLLPDFKWGPFGKTGAQIQLTVYTADYPSGGPVHQFGPYLVTSSTRWVNIRARGRLMRCMVSSSDSQSFWRLGDLRYRGSTDGRRGE